ncbi:hypothetical protein NDU88_002801 [Pleurodeles waltl]|uniref:Phosphoprotein n=1 Tax=Pleurodeles waltl TaxID=8319 RepID=A0AAV7W0D3_PLEWA|nr:hypothetical protein NDU88_002801 [Pleurodeles waltl]
MAAAGVECPSAWCSLHSSLDTRAAPLPVRGDGLRRQKDQLENLACGPLPSSTWCGFAVPETGMLRGPTVPRKGEDPKPRAMRAGTGAGAVGPREAWQPPVRHHLQTDRAGCCRRPQSSPTTKLVAETRHMSQTGPKVARHGKTKPKSHRPAGQMLLALPDRMPEVTIPAVPEEMSDTLNKILGAIEHSKLTLLCDIGKVAAELGLLRTDHQRLSDKVREVVTNLQPSH